MYRVARSRVARDRIDVDAQVSDAIIATRTVDERGRLPAQSLYGVRKM